MVVITTPLTVGSGVVDTFIAEDRYAIVVTPAGINIVDLFEGQVVGSGTLPDVPTCVTADWLTSSGSIYIGTVASGIFSARYHPSRRRDFSDSLIQKFTTSSTPAISSNEIRDLDCLPGRLLIGTGGGVDFLSGEKEFASRTLASGVNAVHLTAAGGGYWATRSGTSGEVEVVYDLLLATGTGIIIPDFSYSATSNPALPAEPPFDIALTESSPRVLAFATSAGALVTQELPGTENLAQRKTLLPDDPETTQVDFSYNATFDSGRLYVTTSDSVIIFDLNTNNPVSEHYVSEGTRGQTLLSGTVNSMRTTTIA